LGESTQTKKKGTSLIQNALLYVTLLVKQLTPKAIPAKPRPLIGIINNINTVKKNEHLGVKVKNNTKEFTHFYVSQTLNTKNS
jgi:hypothetical protein